MCNCGKKKIKPADGASTPAAPASTASAGPAVWTGKA
jgi:hypothetical protein